MHFRRLFLIVLIGILLLAVGSVSSVPSTARAAPPAQGRGTLSSQTASLMFIQNVGQFPDEVHFQVPTATGTLWLAEDALWVTVMEPLTLTPSASLRTGPNPSPYEGEEAGE